MEMSVFFAHIKGISDLSKNMTPKENFDFINSLFKKFGPLIRKNDGFIDKFIGEGIMALFEKNPDDAINTAIKIRIILEEYNSNRIKKGYKEIEIGIGIHVGKIMLGTIGENERMDGTVISNTVNIASRLEGLTTYFGAPIIISQDVIKKTKNSFHLDYRILGLVQVKGISKEIKIYEILAGNDSDKLRFKKETKYDFEKAYSLYLTKNFEEAVMIFENILRVNPGDKASSLYLGKCKLHSEFGTSETWNGLIKMNTKE